MGLHCILYKKLLETSHWICKLFKICIWDIVVIKWKFLKLVLIVFPYSGRVTCIVGFCDLEAVHDFFQPN